MPGRSPWPRGDLVAAEREYNAFLAGLAPDDRALALPARLHLAEIAARQGAVARAESLANAAFDDLDRWRGQVDDRTLRLQALALRELDLDPGLGLPVIAGAMAAEGRAEAALALVERGRGRELADAQLAPRELGGDRHARRCAEAQPARSFVPDSATAVIEFVIGGPTEPTLALLLTRGAVRAFAGPPVAGLEDAVARFRGLVESGADPLRLDAGFTATLIGPVLEAIPPGVTTLVIVPDGPLYRVPFDALKLSQNELVVNRFAVVVAPSVSTIQPAPPVQSTAPTLVLAIANPLLATPPTSRPGRNRISSVAPSPPPADLPPSPPARAKPAGPPGWRRARPCGSAQMPARLAQAGAARPVHPDPHRRPRRGERRRPRRLGGGTGTRRRGGWLRDRGRSGGTVAPGGAGGVVELPDGGRGGDGRRRDSRVSPRHCCAPGPGRFSPPAGRCGTGRPAGSPTCSTASSSGMAWSSPRWAAPNVRRARPGCRPSSGRDSCWWAIRRPECHRQRHRSGSER